MYIHFIQIYRYIYVIQIYVRHQDLQGDDYYQASYICINIYKCIYMYVFAYLYMYIYIVYIHVYTYIQICV